MESQNFETREIIAKLAKLQADMDYVKAHIEDITLTDEDLRSISEAEEEYKRGETTSLEDLKKEIGA